MSSCALSDQDCSRLILFATVLPLRGQRQAQAYQPQSIFPQNVHDLYSDSRRSAKGSSRHKSVPSSTRRALCTCVSCGGEAQFNVARRVIASRAGRENMRPVEGIQGEKRNRHKGLTTARSVWNKFSSTVSVRRGASTAHAEPSLRSSALCGSHHRRAQG